MYYSAFILREVEEVEKFGVSVFAVRLQLLATVLPP